MMARILALDVGEARIGVAVSDASQILASPYTTLEVGGNEARLWEALRRIIEENEVEALVVGLPISLDGQIHQQGERVLAFVERLKRHIKIPVDLWDERLSTVEAQRLLAEREQEEGGRRSRRGGHRGGQGKGGRNRQGVDALAAALILQQYLNHRHQAPEEASQ
ncbi:MAG: Holliday junction resolvase RuvX [Thermogemmatispora sp.]|jgi:putative Holliday junction resolvase|uniref:Putative pre-16S rRNA nuclease n=1 Tax=Thermogemmatispora aurantia TaxID=2045279 RepID=A0A5J4K938_9CHLR|nr:MULTISPECIES: Holliday junction resolvase RuvX [Thermogemmatispora]MBE3564429.1 Holliday junction resolvase RuvX [Thermogemmatispora sp.]GER82656.1 putative pre-16S rRNA nuclease [Thermogemmatispora aurantia]